MCGSILLAHSHLLVRSGLAMCCSYCSQPQGFTVLSVTHVRFINHVYVAIPVFSFSFSFFPPSLSPSFLFSFLPFFLEQWLSNKNNKELRQVLAESGCWDVTVSVLLWWECSSNSPSSGEENGDSGLCTARKTLPHYWVATSSRAVTSPNPTRTSGLWSEVECWLFGPHCGQCLMSVITYMWVRAAADELFLFTVRILHVTCYSFSDPYF